MRSVVSEVTQKSQASTTLNAASAGMLISFSMRVSKMGSSCQIRMPNGSVAMSLQTTTSHIAFATFPFASVLMGAKQLTAIPTGKWSGKKNLVGSWL